MIKRLVIILLFAAQIAIAQQNSITTIAFGSCADEQKPKEIIWGDVLKQKPELWIWLGDNIYGDTDDMKVMKRKYDLQKSHPDYQKLIANCTVIGTWDDHDYGINDGGKEYTMKKESKALLLEFLNVPPTDPVRDHEGVYSSYIFGNGNKKVKVILLDTRYFRDSLRKSSSKDKLYEPSQEGDILGEEQWKWLEKELTGSDAALHIIGTSIQFIPVQHGYEKWANLSQPRERMLTLLRKLQPKNTFFISGDRHIAEISKMTVEGLPYPLYDFTSSGLSHTWQKGWEENQYRVGELIKKKNFGIIRVDWSGLSPKVIMEVRGENNAKFLTHTHQY